MQGLDIRFQDGTRRTLDISARPELQSPEFISSFLRALHANARHAAAGSAVTEIVFRGDPNN